MKRWILWLPLLVFGGFFALFASGLIAPSDRVITSRLVGKPLPQFALPASVENRPGLSSMDFADGKPRLLNIFASWCVPCAAEAPNLTRLHSAGADIHAIAIRDSRADVNRFLTRYGNPYSRIGADDRSSVQIALGSSGVPETFVINGKGIITHQHVGDIRDDDVPILLQKLKEAQ